MKLSYFNVRGLAETTRILLAYSGEDYEDFRYPLEVIDFSTHTMVKEEFDSDKSAGKLVKSMNKVPFLEVEDTIICQSKSIERYLGRRFKLMGDTEIESAHIDAICECVRDIKDLYQGVRKSDDKDKAMSEWFTVTLVDKLSLLENQITGSGFSVGVRRSLSDIVLFSFITQFFDNKEASLNATLVSPKLRSVIDSVSSEESIQKWLSDRPITDF